MNCKPGDLAIVVRTGVCTKSTLGRLIRVLRRLPDAPHQFDPAGVRWAYEPRLFSDLGVEIEVMNDCCLRPIRPQPDDAVDQTLLWLPVPTKEHA